MLLKFSTTEQVVFVNSLASGGNYGSLNLEGSTVEIRGGVKQTQFTKPTPEPRARNPEESNGIFDCVIR